MVPPRALRWLILSVVVTVSKLRVLSSILNFPVRDRRRRRRKLIREKPR